MATRDIQHSQDGNWQAEFVAFKTILFFYNTIGATLTVRRKEIRRSWFGFGAPYEAWIDTPAVSIRLQHTYTTTPSPSGATRQIQRTYSTRNEASCDGRETSAGASITIEASADPGFPDPAGTGPPVPITRLGIDSLQSTGFADIGTETLSLSVDVK